MSKSPEQVQRKGETTVLKVAASSDVGKLAGAIVKFMAEGARVELSAIGAGAVNQAVKAIAVARGMGATAGKDLYCIPFFQDEVFGRDGPAAVKTAMKFAVRDQLR
jgi:stage V sporulation protein S